MAGTDTIVQFHDLRDSSAIPEHLFLRAEKDLSQFIEKAQPIINSVREQGDAALAECARKYDGVNTDAFNIRATEEEFTTALGMVDEKVTEAIRFSADNIRRFHESQKPISIWWQEMSPGVWAGERYLPIEAVACYVPHGKGSFPSVLLMTATPAMVAGVPRPIVITPPGPDGRVDAATLVAARQIGITEVYKCGGAQGIAAVAYGTETVPKCDKVVGPGSPWTVAAKHILRDVIDPGIPAGPSECLILADERADGVLCALDLTIESEHGPDSSAYLVTNSEEVAMQAIDALPGHWAEMGEQRAGFSKTVLGGPQGGVILTRDFEMALDFVNGYAPEHLEIMTRDPLDTLGHIRHAGEVLLGTRTPVSIGNYVLGPNAVLPTSGAARVTSPLSVADYMKHTSVGYVTAEGYAHLAEHTGVLARYEGFDAHDRAISSIRNDLLE